MLRITVPGIELYDEVREEFTNAEGFVLELEHSLVSLSKWESLYEKPFLSKENHTDQEVIDYIRAMILNDDYPEEVIGRLSKENFEQVNAYIDAKMTATWFAENKNEPKSREIITAELIYYWMIKLNIPIEFERWHLNRLFTLIRVFNLKEGKQRKMSRSEILARNRELNAQRKAQLGTSG